MQAALRAAFAGFNMSNITPVLRKPKDLTLGLIFLGIAIGVGVYSAEYELGTARQMGPGFMPLMLALLLGFFGAVLLVGSFFGDYEPAEPIGIQPAILVLGAVALFGFLIRPAGLILSVVALVVVAGFAYRPRKVLPLASFAICLAAACVFLFPWMLGQQIPVIGSWFK